jgi:hypothetical protein
MAKAKYAPAGASAHVVDQVDVSKLRLKGFAAAAHVPKSSYRDTSMVVVVPSRGPWLHRQWVESFNALMWPMNGKRAVLFASGAEVGRAYSECIQGVLAHPQLRDWRYVLTIEDDNLPPPDAAIRLLESIEAGPFDAVGGLYYTKGAFNMPQCYGDPYEFARTGVLDFRPRDILSAVQQGHVVPCNGIAMGCSLYRMQLFRDIPGPWFVTCSDVYEEGARSMTQDLYFCERAARAGKRFAVDCRVHVGHADWETGEIY